MARLLFALENEDVGVTEEVPAEEVLENQAEAEVAHDEVVEVTEDVAELQEAIEEGIESGETLNGLAEIVEPKVEDGEGISPETAAVVEVAIESIRTRLGIRGKLGKMPALENFKTPRSRPEATRIALEASIKETLKAIWEKIKAFATTIWEKIKAFIANLIKNYGMLEKHLEGLKAKVVTMKGTPVKAELEKGSLAKFFSVSGKANAQTALQLLGKAANFESAAKSILAFVGTEIATVGSNPTAVTFDSFADKFVAAVKKENGVTGALPGGVTLEVNKTEAGLEVEFKADKAPAKTITALSKEDAETIIDTAIAEAKNGPKLKEVSAQTEKIVKMVTATADKVIKAFESKDAAEKEGYKDSSKIANALIKTTSKIAGKLPSLHFATVKHAGDYVTASLANTKKAAEAPAAGK